MARRKVKLEYIRSMSQRRSTYRKRKRGLSKKIDEIRILCDIEAAAVIYSPFETEPVVLPNHETVVKVFTDFQNMPEMEKTKRMMTQEMFLRQRIEKMREQTRKIKREIKEKEMTNTIYDVLNEWKIDPIYMLDLKDVNELKTTIERYIHQVRMKKQKAMGQENQQHHTGAEPAAMEFSQLTLTTRTPFGEGTSRSFEKQPMAADEPAAMELGLTTCTPFGEGTSRAFEQQTQKQQEVAVPAPMELTRRTPFGEGTSRAFEQQSQHQEVPEPAPMEVGLRTPFGEGSNRVMERTQQLQHYQAAIEAQSMEETQHQLMQFLTQREQQLQRKMIFQNYLAAQRRQQQQQPQVMFQQQNPIVAQSQQQQQQQSWFSNILNPQTPPQNMEFLQPPQPGAFGDYVNIGSATGAYTPLPPRTFGDHNTSGNNATLPDNSSFRFP